MRTLGVVLVAALVATTVAMAAEETCIKACDVAFDSCRAKADTDALKCRDDAYDPCDEWCPCDHFEGPGWVACMVECDTCEAEAEEIVAKCPKAADAKATCAAERRTCEERCAEDE